MKNPQAQTRELDLAEYLYDEEVIELFLNMELKEGYLHSIKSALQIIARARMVTDLANKMGISRAEVFNLLYNDDVADPSIIEKCITAMGIKILNEPLNLQEAQG